MRPVRLILQAFGPYSAKQVIDFRTLGKSTFLLITGPTGAGKTSVLDGITFALYGDTSTSQRQVRQMRSDHAGSDVQTEVELDFMIGDDSYRIKRAPEQSSPKKRGKGFTKKNPKATLWCRNGIHDDNDPGKVLATQYGEVTEKVEEILGFRSDQFRQVVVLPQGQFRDFLLAGSGKREEILEILFKTGNYRFIQETLKEKAKDVRNRWENAATIRNSRLLDTGTEFLEVVEKQLAQTIEHTANLSADIIEIRKKVDAARIKVEEGKRSIEIIREKQAAENHLKSLKEQEEIFQKKKKIIQQARKALPLKEMESQYKTRKEEKKTAITLHEDLKMTYNNVVQEGSEAKKQLDEWKKKEPRKEELIKEIAQLEEYGKKVSQIENARSLQKEADMKLKQAEDMYEQIKLSIEEITSMREKKRKLYQEKRDLAVSLEGLKNTCEVLSTIYDDRLKLDTYRANYLKAEKDMKLALLEYEKAETNVRKLKIEVDELQIAWQKGQAAVIATGLKESEPCPVCGSLEHPSPAKSNESVPAEEELNQKRTELDKSAEIKQKQSDVLADKTRDVKILENDVNNLIKRLQEHASEPPGVIKESLDRRKKDLELAEDAAAVLGTLEKDMQDLTDREKKQRERLEDIDAKIKQAAKEKGKGESQVDELETAIPPNLQSEDTLLSTLHALEKEKSELETSLIRIKKKAEDTAIKLAEYRINLKNAESMLAAAEKAAMEHEEKFLKSVRDAGFSSIEEYTAACMSEDEISGIDKKAQEYQSSLQAADQRLSRARSKAENIEMPDLDTLQSVYDQALKTLQDRTGEEGRLKNEIEQRKKLIGDVKKMERKLSELEKQYQILGSISDIANGRNGLGITFQRFVQTALLDDVLIAASRRLSVMSKGRFLLRRVVERTDRRTSGGLDLEVDDSYTGKSRPVSTLSGGESFLAALSLALGLADVVQSYSGGVRLDTLFIDEGFGSLDTESLDLALQALMDLQKGGRLVAVISHVAELQERIDTRLEIIPGKTGSRARFVTV